MLHHRFLPLLLIIPSLGAAEIDVRRHIEVDGTAEIRVTPDFATWQIVIRGEAESLAEASGYLDESSEKLSDSLTSAGLSEESVKLSGISSGRYYETVDKERVFKGFFAERNVIVELRDLNKRQELEKILLQDDRVKISEVIAQSSSHEENRKKALLSAASVAKEKASALAGTLDAEIGVPLSIRQGSSSYRTIITSNRIETSFFGGEPKSTQLEALSYSSTVTVKFELK